MSEHIFKRHNKNLLMYHLVFPAKYRKKIFSAEIDKTLKEICIELSQNYEILFLEIGTDQDHVHFLVQSVPILSVTKIVTIIKSITAKQLFILHPENDSPLRGAPVGIKPQGKALDPKQVSDPDASVEVFSTNKEETMGR